MSDLQGKTALVTGGSRGIGSGIVQSLARAGAQVALTATSQESADAGVALASECGPEVFGYAADVRDSARAQEVVSDLMEKWGHLDILVCNAGITRDGLLVRMTDEDFDDVIDTNLKGCLIYSRAVAKPMAKQRAGVIVNISSIVGITGNAGQSNYAAAKAGIFGFSKSLASELGGRGIRVNAVAPGYIQTDMTSELPEQVREQSLARIPLGRLGETHDIASAVNFLVSDAAAYITGTTLVVDGGLSL